MHELLCAIPLTERGATIWIFLQRIGEGRMSLREAGESVYILYNLFDQEMNQEFVFL